MPENPKKSLQIGSEAQDNATKETLQSLFEDCVGFFVIEKNDKKSYHNELVNDISNLVKANLEIDLFSNNSIELTEEQIKKVNSVVSKSINIAIENYKKQNTVANGDQTNYIVKKIKDSLCKYGDLFLQKIGGEVNRGFIVRGEVVATAIGKITELKISCENGSKITVPTTVLVANTESSNALKDIINNLNLDKKLKAEAEDEEEDVKPTQD